MQAESTIRPQPFNVEICGGLAEVVLFENITEQTRTDTETGEASTYFKYDEHRITVPYRDNLPQEVEDNRAAWLSAAIAAENAAEEKRTLEEEVAKLKTDNAIMGAALEEVIAIVAGGE